MIRFPEARLCITYFVRKDDFDLFIEEFFRHPQTKSFLRKKDCKSMLQSVSMLIDSLREDDEGAFFYCEKTNEDNWVVSEWSPLHWNTRTWHGKPIEFNPTPILDDLIFGGEDD